MTDRNRLPNRRSHDVFEFEHSGVRYSAGIGTFTDGRPAELFLNAAKSGTAIETYARDAAIIVSLALQHGCTVDTLRHAVTRNQDGSPSGPIGAVLDHLGDLPTPTNAPTNGPDDLPTPLPTPIPSPLPTGTNALPTACPNAPHTPGALEGALSGP
jgi:hypothetical protein